LRVLIVEGYGVRLGVRRRCLVIESRSGRKIVPLAEIDRVVLATSRISVTTAALRMLARAGVDVVVLDSRGKPMTLLTPPWITRTVDTRRAQYLAHADPSTALGYAKSFAVAKICNQASYLRYLAHRLGERSLLEDAARIEEKASQVLSVEGPLEEARKSVMGIEGNAARIYWGAIATLIPRDLGFPGRDQDSCDPVNACLNYLYGMLYAECFRALTRFGLDPFAGFLHVDRSGKPVLVFDFVEMFRVSAVDSLLLKALREGFRPRLESCLLTADTRGKLIEMFSRWIERRCRERMGEVKRLRNHISSHALKLGRALRNRASYRGFVEEWWR